MTKLVTFLESKQVVFLGAIVLMAFYVPHAGHLFMQLEHLDLTFYNFKFFNWIYGMGLAAVFEFLILIFIVNGRERIGKFYAIISFFLNLFYYDYLFLVITDSSPENIKATIISLFVCVTHSLSVWQLSELFNQRVIADKEKEEYWCSECDAGPFPNKRSLDGHVNKAHRSKKRFPIKEAETLN
ncbi:MAG TPA: hypothetical protein VFE50_22200 [Cyclobacteriaceae bacterium]|nr:hypothetical protein [Cyclobacteriaceae bacterium]